MRGHLEGEVTRIRACARVRRAVEPPPASGSIAGEARSPRISAGDDVSSHPGSSGGAGAGCARRRGGVGPVGDDDGATFGGRRRRRGCVMQSIRPIHSIDNSKSLSPDKVDVEIALRVEDAFDVEGVKEVGRASLCNLHVRHEDARGFERFAGLRQLQLFFTVRRSSPMPVEVVGYSVDAIGHVAGFSLDATPLLRLLEHGFHLINIVECTRSENFAKLEPHRQSHGVADGIVGLALETTSSSTRSDFRVSIRKDED